MLKKIIPFLFLLLSTPFFAAAQPETFKGHEVSLGYGLMPFVRMMNSFDKRLGDFQYTATGVFSLTYRYHFSRIMSIGLTVGVDHETVSFTNQWDPGSRSHDYSTMRYKLAPEITFKYIENENGNFRLYGLLGIGATYRVERGQYNNAYNDYVFKQWGPDIQLTPIAVRVGRTLGGFVELGLGYKGLVNCGIAYRL